MNNMYLYDLTVCVKAERYSISVTQQSENLNSKMFWTERELDQPENYEYYEI